MATKKMTCYHPHLCDCYIKGRKDEIKELSRQWLTARQITKASKR